MPHLAENQDDLGDHSHSHNPHDVAGDEEEGFLCGGAEAVPKDGRLYVGVLVEELHALLQTPQAALHAAQNGLRFGTSKRGRVGNARAL